MLDHDSDQADGIAGTTKGGLGMTSTRGRRPTMRDVAERAGVSFKTVSRVVNGERGVSPAVVARVVDAVEALGYRPDDRARRLRQGATTTGAIGFILVDVSNPFFSSIHRGIEDAARTRDYLVLAGSNDGIQERQDQLVSAFLARRVDGLIVVAANRDIGTLQAEIDRMPIVFLDIEPDVDGIDLVRTDHRGGAQRATRHLIDHGHDDIAFFGDDPTIMSAGERLAGFRDAMTAAALDVPDHRMTTGRHAPDTWRTIVTDHLRRPTVPTALFTAQNFITIGAAHALHDLDLHHRIAHIGFDDVELGDIVDPAISVVPQHPWELGRRAAELLFRRIDGDDAAPVRDILDESIVERGSGEIPGPRSGDG